MAVGSVLSIAATRPVAGQASESSSFVKAASLLTAAAYAARTAERQADDFILFVVFGLISHVWGLFG